VSISRPKGCSRNGQFTVVALAVVLVLVAGTVSAFQVTPLNIELTAQGAGRIESITVENTNPDPIAVQIRTYTREVLPNGTERNEPLDGVFRVYPSQMILQPGQTQVVRV
jgi:fimbrial chaperone protein